MAGPSNRNKRRPEESPTRKSNETIRPPLKKRKSTISGRGRGRGRGKGRGKKNAALAEFE